MSIWLTSTADELLYLAHASKANSSDHHQVCKDVKTPHKSSMKRRQMARRLKYKLKRTPYGDSAWSRPKKVVVVNPWMPGSVAITRTTSQPTGTQSPSCVCMAKWLLLFHRSPCGNFCFSFINSRARLLHWQLWIIDG
jgi:hypothetical protein